MTRLANADLTVCVNEHGVVPNVLNFTFLFQYLHAQINFFHITHSLALKILIERAISKILKPDNRNVSVHSFDPKKPDQASLLRACFNKLVPFIEPFELGLFGRQRYFETVKLTLGWLVFALVEHRCAFYLKHGAGASTWHLLHSLISARWQLPNLPNFDFGWF